MIASPGDVAKERQLARDVIHEWNDLHSEQTGIVLLPISWETHSSPEMGNRPQAIINKQILKDADLLIGIFWTKLGTPTGKAESGTVEEIEEHIKSDKPAMVYFSKEPVLPDSIDQEQYKKLKEFKESIHETGLYHDYDSLSQFRGDLYRHLVLKINNDDHFQNTIAKPIGTDSMPSTEMISKAKWSFLEPGLSKEAKKLLIEAVEDENGTILSVRTMRETTIQTNNHNFIENQDSRTVAIWKSALSELRDNGFIEDRGCKEEVFAVTRLGFEYADVLMKENAVE